MNFFKLWLGLPLQKQFVSLVGIFMTGFFLFMMANVALRPKMALLYSGVDSASAGEVLAKLDGLGVAYEVRGSAIYTDTRRRDTLRLELAREGLPRQSVIGYELFDDLNSFAMSSDMFDTAYWRAKEGELARTILAMPNIKGARVHLGTQKSDGFGRNAKALTASVTLSTTGALSLEQAKAVQFITALAVVGLNPEDVAIIDTVRGLVTGPGFQSEAVTSASGELERAAQLKGEILSLLEARVGRGNVRVSVALDIDRVSETLTERKFDPEGRVLKSQTTQETTNSSTGTRASTTVASNLPDGEAGGANSTSEQNKTVETTQYEISEILRNKDIAAGTIQRMTIAVLLADLTEVGEDGEVTRQVRSDAELQVLSDLVAAAAGINETRGDKLTVRSLPFDMPAAGELVAKPSSLDVFKDQYLWSSIQLAVLGLASLILGLFVVRPMLSASSSMAGTDAASQLAPLRLDGAGGGPINADGTALDGPEARPRLEGPSSIESNPNAAAELALSNGVDPQGLLQSQAAEGLDDAADLLASWLEGDMRGAE